MAFDLAIIGAGPGGYVAALRAARSGIKVALIEKDQVGGTCLNRGCIPTKALAASAHIALVIANEVKQSTETRGIATPAIELWRARNDLTRAQSRKDQIVCELRSGVGQLLKAAGIEIIKGAANFVQSNRIEVDGDPLDAGKIIIATGSAWWVPQGLKLDGKFIVSSDEALSWNETPKSLVIVGGGVIGCEFASIFSAFGSKVTIVEAMSSILPPVERSISRLLSKSFKDRGMEIFTETTVQSAEVKESTVSVKLSNGQEKNADRVLVCVGRKPDVSAIGIDKTQIELTDRGAIKVNERFETTVKGVFAIGDVIGNWMLAHVASAEGISCVEQMTGKGEPVNYNAIPSPIFTMPEIASVGSTAEELAARKVSFKTGRFPYAASGKARCDGETEGMAIVHVDGKGLILGAHFFGKDATMLASEATLAVKHGLTAHDVGGTIHAHPTISEIFAEAALDAVGEAIHKAQVRRPKTEA